MVAVGYYSSLCQGMSMMFGVINMATGVALSIFGVLVIMDKLTKPFGYMYLGYLMVAAGLFILINSIINMIGTIRESKPSLKGGLIGTSVVVFLLLAIVAYAFMLMGKVERGGRAAYLKLSDKEKIKVEKRLECCGWDDPAKDHSPNCLAKHTCDKPMGKELKKTAFIRLVIPGAALLVQALVLFSVGCFFRKLTKQKGPKMNKNISLAEESTLRMQGKSLEEGRMSRKKKKELHQQEKERKRQEKKEKK